MTSAADAKGSLGLYIHVPFCLKKCPYCDFYSCENSLHKRDAYVQAVCRNLRAYGKGQKVDTIYFGGGTPSLLKLDHIAEIIMTAKESFSLSLSETTIEVNPATVTAEMLCGYRAIGIDRISIGVQDLQDDTLETLGRLHTAQQAADAVYAAKHAGFDNISCDLMIGTKGQTKKRLTDTMEELTSMSITHISAYLLKIEEGTPYARSDMKFLVPSDDETADLYLHMVEFLENKGFSQYEVSNFALPGYHSRHNCRYWKCEPYLGVGPSAHSCMNTRFYVNSNLDEFIKSHIQNTIIEDEAPCDKNEKLMLRLRLTEGAETSHFSEKQKKIIEKYVNAGFMQTNNNRVSFTPKGFLVMNSILTELLWQ